MAYTINLTNGTILTTIADGTVNNTASSITLIGKNYAGYGTFLNTDMVHILENFASTTAPTSPLTGQLWWDSAGNLKVYNGSTFRTLGTMTASNSSPTSSVTGNSWWDTFNQQLYIYNGTGWVLIGPAFTSNTGQSGTIVGTITDSTAVNHVAVNVYVSNTLVSIISKDSEYTPQTVISGFTTIKPGYNLSTAIANIAFVGTASDSDKLGSIAASNYARRDVATSFSGTISVLDNNGVSVGASGNYTIGVSGVNTVLRNNINNADTSIIANVSGTLFTALNVNGGDGKISIPAGFTAGASSSVAGNVYATNFVGNATSAFYADLAERFAADAIYGPGTVLKLGGEKEVTIENNDLSNDVFGVVSSEPAYLMNSAAGDNSMFPPVALSGRVPVRVIGKVNKNDRLVSAGNGLARAATLQEITPFNVIGRSLEDKHTTEEGIINAAVLLNK